MNGLKLGIEIEAIFNSKLSHLAKLKIEEYDGGYLGRNKGLKSWKVERDGSLDNSTSIKWHSWGKGVEFISKLLKSKRSYTNVLNEFQLFISKNNTYELKDVLCFNESCGNHIHFSVPHFTFKKKTLFKIYPEVRQKFFDLIKASHINKKSKRNIIKHYFRHYALRLDKKEFKKSVYRSRKYTEFNFRSEASLEGLEWRSLNLKDIQTWDEFKELFEIFYKCINYLVKLALKWEEKAEYKPRIRNEKNKLFENEVEEIKCVI